MHLKICDKGRSHVKCSSSKQQQQQQEQQQATEGHKEMFGGNGYFYYLGYGDSNVNVYVFPNLPNCVR